MKAKCFVIIPFQTDYEAIYEHVIKPTLSHVNVEALISRDVKGIEWPFKKIHSAIRDSRFCIADISEPNENVMYEVGYASALEKKTILIWDTFKRPQNPAFDVNYFHGEPYDSQDKTWSVKLAQTLKGHFEAEMKKPMSAMKLKAPTSVEGLSKIEIKIICILEIANANNQEIGVTRLPELLESLGEDRVDSSLCLDNLLHTNFINRSYNAQGSEVCNYYNAAKAKEYLRQHPDALKKMRKILPKSFNGYAPVSPWI